MADWCQADIAAPHRLRMTKRCEACPGILDVDFSRKVTTADAVMTGARDWEHAPAVNIRRVSVCRLWCNL